MALAARQRRPAPTPSVQTVHQPAPIGGFNTIDPGTQLPELDCVYAYNLIAADKGARVRLGYQTIAEGLTGFFDNTVRSVVPFHGSRKNGSTDKLFALTSSGIWDVTAGGTTVPPAGPDYPYTNLGGNQIQVSNPAGIRLGDTIREDVTLATASVGLIQGTTITLSSVVGSFAGPGTFTDTSYTPYTPLSPVATWPVQGGEAGYATFHSFTTAAGKFLLLCDEANGYYVYTENTSTWAQVTMGGGAGQVSGVDPTGFVFVTVWKNRVWLVNGDTTEAWYLDVNSIYGAATKFDFGAKMKQGGPLVGLWNWSYDGGSGMDTALVGVSGGGDVVIYQGTDPSSVDTFGLKGCWSLGAVPSGRRIATDYGGDLLLLSLLGAVPLSKLVIGNPSVDRTIYSTAKIAPYFNGIARQFAQLHGWSIHIQPTDNALLVLVPQAEGSPTTQLAMAFVSRSWWLYRDLPMLSACTWEGDFYFGTADGRVCRNYGYVDNVPRDPGTAGTTGDAIQWSLLTPYRNKGAPTNKQVQMVRATFVSGETVPTHQATAKYNLDLSEPPAVVGGPTGDNNSWDIGLWDVALWQPGDAPAAPLRGASGMGREVAIAIRGNAVSKTTLIGIDVYFTEGGLL